MNSKKIPQAVISRLFIYLRELTELAKVKITTISSAELGDRTNLSDAQVRKDLGYFGNFGVSGSGYAVNELVEALEKILGKNKVWNVALVGAGHLGSALLSYPGFKSHGLNIISAFDISPKRIGKAIGDIKVKPLKDIKKEISGKKIEIGIITVPAKSAQSVCDKLIDSGIECILNFAPVALNAAENIKIRDVDLSREIETLSYFLVNKK